MKKFIFLITGFLFALNLVSAETNGTITKTLTSTPSRIYSNSGEFLKSEGSSCQVATDGCNTIQIDKGQLGASTMMYCEDIYGPKGQQKRQCIKTIDKEEDSICTMEYAPVCGNDLKTYGNSCMAKKAGIAYVGECNDFIDKDLYKKLSKYESKIKSKIKSFSKSKLDKLLININKNIENIKLQRISQKFQIEKITKYYFVRQVIEIELSSRN